jgi:hypothetical protein
MAVVYRKTPKGVAEIGTRAFRLAPRLRGALILVDGRKTDAELAALILAEPQATLAALLADGFIEVAATLADRPAERRPSSAPTATASVAPRDGASFETTRRDAVRQLNDQLGPGAETLAIKMERTAAMRELQPLLVQAVALLRSARGAAVADAFAARFIGDSDA